MIESKLENLNYSGFQGSGLKHLDKDFLKRKRVLCPPILEQKKIASILTSVEEVIAEKRMKLIQTQSLKKSLMQDLLTGKVRVKVQ